MRQGKLRKIIVFVLSLAIISSLFWGMSVTTKITNATALGEVAVKSGYLNVRKGPGTNYGLLTDNGVRITLEDGHNVNILSKNGKWYRVKFTMAKKTYKGYIYSSYVKVQTGGVRTSIPAKTSGRSLTLAKAADEKATQVKINGAPLKLAKGTVVKILSEKVVQKKKWYYISAISNKKTYKGYVRAKDITVSCAKGMPAKIQSSGQITLKKSLKNNKVVKIGGKQVSLSGKQIVTVLKDKKVNNQTFYYIKGRVGTNEVKGYIPEYALLFQIVKREVAAVATARPTATGVNTPPPVTATKSPATPTPVANNVVKDSNKATASPTKTKKPSGSNLNLSDKQFQKKMQAQGFPDDYIVELAKLHKAHPSWDFQAFHTGIEWSQAILAESKVGLNLLSNAKSIDWKSLAGGAYNWNTDSFIPYDGSTWVTASEKAVRYYMDPRNFLDETSIFQFELLEYQSGTQTQTGVENILKNTPMYKSKYSYTNASGKEVEISYSKTFMKAAQASGVSPYHLASRAKQEVVVSSTKMSSSVSGTVSSYPGIYNFYNIGANNSTAKGGAVANGLKWASSGTTFSRPWNNRYRAIVGGAKYIGNKYINVGQNTLYLQKFNVTSTSRYNHQYMANIEAPNSEATKTAKAYGTSLSNAPIVFSIPVYLNMPSEACEMPSGGKNPNNYLKTLYIKNHAFKSAFKVGDTGSKIYKATVSNSVDSIKISATSVSNLAVVTGTGNKKLDVGINHFTIKVKAANGSSRKYKIQVTRKE